MFKKALFFVLAVVLMQCVCFASDTVSWYPKHLYDDEKYVLSESHMGTVWYVDKDSIEVESETEDEHVLSVTVVGGTFADHRPPYSMDDIRHVEYMQYAFLYDTVEQKIYVASDKESDEAMYSDLQYNRFVYINRDDTTWRYIDPHGCWADVGIIKNASLVAFKEKYNRDFY